MTTDLWTAGDSITAGTWLADPGTQSWPARLDQALGGGRVRNLGVGGMAVAHTDDNLPETVANVVRVEVLLNWDRKPRAVVLAGGINDLIRESDTAALRWGVLGLTAWLERQGVQAYVCTLTPYRADAQWAATLSARRADYNGWARTQYGPAGRLVDVGDVLTAGDTYADPRFYLDPLHPNAEGAKLYADTVATVLREKGLG